MTTVRLHAHPLGFTDSGLMEEDKESEGSSSGFSEEESQPNAYEEIAIPVQHKDFETLVLQILKAELKADSKEKDSGEIEDSKSYVVRTKKSGRRPGLGELKEMTVYRTR